MAELSGDSQALPASLREAHDLCNEQRNIEGSIDGTERRIALLFEATRHGDSSTR